MTDGEKKTNNMLAPQISVGGHVQLFNTKMLVFYQHKPHGIYSDEFVIYHHSPIDESMSLTEMAGNIYGSLSELINSTSSDGNEPPDESADFSDSIMSQLPSFVTDAMDSISVTLNEVYFHVKRVQADGRLDIEYAFWIMLNYDNSKLKLPLAIEDVYLKIWNTENSNILDEMDISSIKNLLAPPKVVALPKGGDANNKSASDES